MNSACASREPSPYESGRLASGDQRLFRPGGLELTARAIALAHLHPGATILDLGCGAGDTTRWLRAQGFRAIGIDCAPHPGFAASGAEAFIAAPADDVPCSDASVDAILAECSFSLFAEPRRVLSECARILVDGGRFILSDLYARCPEAIAPVRALHGSCAAGMVVRRELETSLSNAGFTVDRWEDHSRALRECAARFLFEHGSLDGLWGCSGAPSSPEIQAAMRAARAGYFLLLATRHPRGRQEGKHE